MTRKRIGWLDSTRAPSHIHATDDEGESTVCDNHRPKDRMREADLWGSAIRPRNVISEVPRKILGQSRYCKGGCFKEGGHSIPWVTPPGPEELLENGLLKPAEKPAVGPTEANTDRVTLFGTVDSVWRLQKDKSGNDVLNLRLVTASFVNQDDVREERTEPLNVSVTGSRAVGLSRVLCKGSVVLVEGNRHIKTDLGRFGKQWSSITVFADNVILKPTEMTVDELHAETRSLAGASAQPIRTPDHQEWLDLREDAGSLVDEADVVGLAISVENLGDLREALKTVMARCTRMLVQLEPGYVREAAPSAEEKKS